MKLKLQKEITGGAAFLFVYVIQLLLTYTICMPNKYGHDRQFNSSAMIDLLFEPFFSDFKQNKKQKQKSNNFGEN